MEALYEKNRHFDNNPDMVSPLDDLRNEKSQLPGKIEGLHKFVTSLNEEYQFVESSEVPLFEIRVASTVNIEISVREFEQYVKDLIQEGNSCHTDFASNFEKFSVSSASDSRTMLARLAAMKKNQEKQQNPEDINLIKAM